jgi:hypothetical protein
MIELAASRNRSTAAREVAARNLEARMGERIDLSQTRSYAIIIVVEDAEVRLRHETDLTITILNMRANAKLICSG